MKQRRRYLSTLGLMAIIGFPLVWLAFSQELSDSKTGVDPDVLALYNEHYLSELIDLRDAYSAHAGQYQILLPPGDDGFILWQPYDLPVQPIALSALDKLADSGKLIGHYENSVVVYPVSLREDPLTRVLTIFNEVGASIGVIGPDPADDPHALLKERLPWLSKALPGQRDWWERNMDRSRIAMKTKLVDSRYLQHWIYVDDRIRQAQMAEQKDLDGEFTMRLMEEPTAIAITDIRRNSGALELDIVWPSEGFTNQLDVFSTDNIYGENGMGVWQKVASGLSSTNPAPITWTWTNQLEFQAFTVASDYRSGDGPLSDAELYLSFGIEDPLDTNAWPVAIVGEVIYAGPEEGSIRVLVVNDSNRWSSARSVILSDPGPFEIHVANHQTWYVKAYMELEEPGFTPWKPSTQEPVELVLTEGVTNVLLEIVDVPSVAGELQYAHGDYTTNDIVVIAVTEPNSWSTQYSTVISAIQGYGSLTDDVVYASMPGPYRLVNVPSGTNLWIRAFMDSAGTGEFVYGCEAGQYSAEPIKVTNRVTGIDFTIDLDTDEDSIPDWWEMEHFGGSTNAVWSEDPDIDGLNNWEEYYFGTDPFNADSDGDWFLDGYEVDMGGDPLDSLNDPGYVMVINNGASHTSSTNVLISFPGIIVDMVEIGETPDLTNTVSIGFGDNLPYSLTNDSNGVRRLYARVYVDAEASPLIQRTIILDTVPPQILGTSPTNGYVTNRRWIKLSGEFTDTVSRVRVFVNDEWAHGGTETTFWHDRIMLQPGTNHFVVRAEDLAGNVTNKTVQIIQDTGGDTIAPALQIFLPGQTIDTNGQCSALYGDAEELYFSGWIDDETAQVLVYSMTESLTNGPWEAVVTGTQVWANVQLQPGTNLLVAMARDAADNTSTTTCRVVRDMDLTFRITYPAPYQVMNTASTVVHGVASPAFLNATITVNNVATTIEDHGSNITFTTISGVPLNAGRTEIIGKATGAGFVYFADPTTVGYEVLSFQDYWTSDWDHYLESECYYEVNQEVRHSRRNWDVNSKHYEYSVEYNPYVNCKYYSQCTLPDVNCGDAPSPQLYTDIRESSEISVGYGYSDYWAIWHDSGYNYSHSIARAQASEVQFIKRWPTQETHWVILQFPGMSYNRFWQHSPDPNYNPALITYRGQTGFWHNANMSFIVPITTEVEYTIKETDFTWPSDAFSFDEPGFMYGYGEHKLLRFNANISNSILSLELDVLDTAYLENRVSLDDERLSLSKDPFARNKLMVWETDAGDTEFSIKKYSGNTSPIHYEVEIGDGSGGSPFMFGLLDTESKDFSLITGINIDNDFTVNYGYDFDSSDSLEGDEVKGSYEVFAIKRTEYNSYRTQVNTWINNSLILSDLGEAVFSRFVNGSFPAPSGTDYRPGNHSGPGSVSIALDCDPHLLTHKFGGSFSGVGEAVCNGKNRPVSTASIPEYVWNTGTPGSLLVQAHSAFLDQLHAQLDALTFSEVSQGYQGASGGTTRDVQFSFTIVEDDDLDLGARGSVGLGRVEFFGAVTVPVTFDSGSGDYTIETTGSCSVSGYVYDIFDFNYFNPDFLPTITGASRAAAGIQCGFSKSGAPSGAGQVFAAKFNLGGSISLPGPVIVVSP